MQNDNSKSKSDLHQRLIRFSISTVKFCSELRTNQTMRTLADQLIRSSTSIGANVIEAKGSGSKREYIHYFEIALKSANETLYWLILVKECDPNSVKTATLLYDEAVQIVKILGTGILTMKGKN